MQHSESFRLEAFLLRSEQAKDVQPRHTESVLGRISSQHSHALKRSRMYGLPRKSEQSQRQLVY